MMKSTIPPFVRPFSPALAESAPLTTVKATVLSPILEEADDSPVSPSLSPCASSPASPPASLLSEPAALLDSQFPKALSSTLSSALRSTLRLFTAPSSSSYVLPKEETNLWVTPACHAFPKYNTHGFEVRRAEEDGDGDEEEGDEPWMMVVKGAHQEGAFEEGHGVENVALHYRGGA